MGSTDVPDLPEPSPGGGQLSKARLVTLLLADVSTEVWDRHVGEVADRPYRPLSGIGEADPAPFTANICGPSQEDPTGLVLDVVSVPAGPCVSTLDHVAATPDLPGVCDTLGEPPDDTERLDGGGGMDHRGIICTLSLTVAGGPAQPLPAAARDTLPATGAPAVAALAATALLLGAALRRRTT